MGWCNLEPTESPLVLLEVQGLTWVLLEELWGNRRHELGSAGFLSERKILKLREEKQAL